MKNKSFVIKIEKPCDQIWSDMHTQNHGRFCTHCSKTVIDFTSFTDEQILEKLTNQTGKICGRFRAELINKNIQKHKYSRSKIGINRFLAGLLLIGLSDQILSDNRFVVNSEQVIFVKNQKSHDEVNKLLPDDSLKVIKGIVLDKSKEPVPYAVVLLKGTNVGCVSDVNGLFTLSIPDSLIHKEMILNISLSGYEPTEYIFHRKNFRSEKEIIITVTPRFLMGDIIIIEKE